MIPFPNVIAGILIGIANEIWSARFIIPLVWGIVYCIYVSFTKREELNIFIEQAMINNRKVNGICPTNKNFTLSNI